MYDKRIKVFVGLCAALLIACVVRLAEMQLLPDSSLRDEIAGLKNQENLFRRLNTVRGRILDRKQRVLASDEPQFRVHINYSLSRFADERFRKAKKLRAASRRDAEIALSKAEEELKTRLEDLQQVIEKCVNFGIEREEIDKAIDSINNRIWKRREFLAWRRGYLDADILKRYDNRIINIPQSVGIADFEKKEPSAEKRILLTAQVDIPEMHKDWPLLELKTDDDIFMAQLEFSAIEDIRILAEGKRVYHYGTAASQTIGWVSPERNRKLFAGDRFWKYLEGEVSGHRPGVEYVCEAVLRGRRGEEVYDIDRELINRTETQLGQDVSLTLDIELQQKIEDYLFNYEHDPNCGPGMSAVIIEVATGDILALVSLPTFDLNVTRYAYGELIKDPAEPLRNRAINKLYPPGSVVKPLILVAGLESGKISTGEVISCPAAPAEKGWPSCWVYNKFKTGHNGRWQNSARNAIKGSCNIYFSRLADRIEPSVLQRWFYDFGYGRKILYPPAAVAKTTLKRDFLQAGGYISSSIPRNDIRHFEDVEPLRQRDRRWFGIGQGNLRVTPLQVANAMAAIARGGLYKAPRLFIADGNEPASDSDSLNISPETLNVIHEGMSAVVNESGGTAYQTFKQAGLDEKAVMIYGKTGSTQEPENAWFAGFAEDDKGRSVAVAIAVEGGQSGAQDAAPLGRDIIRLCIEAEYIGDAEHKE